MITVGTYRHFKGGTYRVLALAIHTETKDQLVIYHEVGKQRTWWARPAKMFSGFVIVNGRRRRRFIRVTA